MTQSAITADRNHALTTNTTLLRAAELAEHILLRYGLALILLWLGCMKFTSYEAHGIMGLEANSPFLRPLLAALGVQGIANLLGVTEIATALLLIVGRFFPRIGLIGSSIATVMFLTTLTFLVTTPGWEPSLGGFPALSSAVGQFLVKDFVLLGAAVYTARESLMLLQDNK
ncbi:YkgB family protein [Terriglobus sp. TAA 43]|uniref:YkgB family protein n=1 Tax=Terriglobus sp. TAA 43 TaxID=278961 RepID=UPI000A03DEC2|nr:DUF417 family protein [Terriglobus sp. TAA 43]